MIKYFIKNVALLIVINVVVKLLYVFGVELGVQNQLGEEQYGIYFTLLNFTWLFQIIVDFGIQNFNQSRFAGHPVLIQKYLLHFLVFKLILGFIFLSVVLTAGYFMGYIDDYGPYLFWLALNQVLLSMVLYLRSNVSALSKYRWDSVFSALDKFFVVLMLGPLLWLDVYGIELSLLLFIQAQTLALVLVNIILLVFLFKHLRPLRFSWNFNYFRVIWRRSRSFALIVFLMFMYTRMDSVLIEKLHVWGQREAGIYAASFRLLDVANLFGFLFASFLIPMFASQRKQTENSKNLLIFSSSHLVVLYITASLVAVLIAEDLIPFLYVNARPYWANVFMVLFPSCVAWGIFYTSGAYLTARGLLSGQIRWFVVGVILNFILNVMLIPSQGAFGAALATLMTQTLMALGVLFLALRAAKISIEPVYIKPWLVYIAFMIGSYLFIRELDFNWILKGGVVGVLSLGLARLIGLLDVDELLSVMRKE